MFKSMKNTKTKPDLNKQKLFRKTKIKTKKGNLVSTSFST